MEKIYKLVIVGRPNDGKSSIFANFLGDDEIAISPIPGETKKMQPREINLGNFRVEIIDTPGLQHPEKIFQKFQEYSESGRKPAEAFVQEFTDSKYSHDHEIMKALSSADICMLVVNADNFFAHTQRCLLDTFSMLGSSVVLVGLINRADSSFLDEWQKEFERRGIDCFGFDAFKSKFKDCATLFEDISVCSAFRRRTELRDLLASLKDNRAALWEGNFDAAATEILNSLRDLMLANVRRRPLGFSLRPDEVLEMKRELAEKIRSFIMKFNSRILKCFKYSGVKIRTGEIKITESDLYIRKPNIVSRIFGELPFVKRPLAECTIDYQSDVARKFIFDAVNLAVAITSISYAQSATKEFDIDISKLPAAIKGLDLEKFLKFAKRAAKGDDSDAFFQMQSELRQELFASLKQSA